MGRSQGSVRYFLNKPNMLIIIDAIWGALAGFIMLLLFSAPVIHLKYIFRYAGRSILIAAVVGGLLGALLGIIQLVLVKKAKI